MELRDAWAEILRLTGLDERGVNAESVVSVDDRGAFSGLL